MSTKFDNQRFAVGKMVGKSKIANTVMGDLVTKLQESQRTLGYGSGLMSAFVLYASEKAFGAVPDDNSETLRNKLPSSVGEHKSIAWVARHYGEGESYEDISANTHTADAETVAKAIDVAATHIDIAVPLNGDESEDAATE